jgi:excisionase family DNA binding protein
MTEERPDPAEDRWLTVAEIAADLRLNPATIRLWIRSGDLPAKRVGRRKLFVLGSDLEQMLESRRRGDPPGGRFLPNVAGDGPFDFAGDGRRVPQSWKQVSSSDFHGRRPYPGETEYLITQLRQADEYWSQAQAASENAPPDPGFARRIHRLANACDEQGHWLLTAATTTGFQWTPMPNRRGLTISHELRPGATRPGPTALWEEFDQAVERLGGALEGSEMYPVAWAYRDLGKVMHVIADTLLADLAENHE